jgi:hypothetical protein
MALDTNKIYTHDEILGYIHEQGGTFNMIYEIETVTHGKNRPDKLIIGTINVLIEYEGVTYECDHLWFDNKLARDEAIRVFRAHKRRKGGARGLVRELNDVSTTTYKGKEGETRYAIYKESEDDGPDDFIIPTIKQKKEQSMNTLREKLERLGLTNN